MGTREKFDLELPGFLVIDTPGHESFTNLRTRGSSLCDMAVLVVDIMHGLEQQTLESMQLLRQRNTPFCIALNKIDRLNQWKSTQNMNTRDTLDNQNYATKSHFEDQLKKTILAFNEQGLNVALYWLNTSPDDTLSFVPTSAITGEGLSDLMFQLCRMGQEQEEIRKKLEEKDEFECTVIEVKVIEGHGTTIDVVLINGVLKVGDTIVISGLNGPISTKIRALLTPHPMKEMRVKGDYMHHKSIKGAMGIKISAPDMDHAIAGSQLFRCENEAEVEEAKQSISDDLIDILEKYVDKTQEGVAVQASTIGSLEALLEYLYQQKIPVAAVNIGPVHKKDILKCIKSTSAGGERQHKEYATILCFDVKVTQEARDFAEEEGIKVFTADIIYHLFDSFTEYVKQCRDERKGDQGRLAVFPCILEVRILG
jgi:translation initiation factor 5B